MKLTRTEILWLVKLLDHEVASSHSYVDGIEASSFRELVLLQAGNYESMERKFERLLLERKDGQEFKVICCREKEKMYD